MGEAVFRERADEMRSAWCGSWQRKRCSGHSCRATSQQRGGMAPSMGDIFPGRRQRGRQSRALWAPLLWPKQAGLNGASFFWKQTGESLEREEVGREKPCCESKLGLSSAKSWKCPSWEKRLWSILCLKSVPRIHAWTPGGLCVYVSVYIQMHTHMHVCSHAQNELTAA